MAKIAITQIKSRINAPKVQKRTLDALGLKKMNHTVVKEDNLSIIGMVKRVSHLVKVEPAN
ncbi:MAG: 50S ribosomal protein L30 [Muribaculaceae bacterium]|nr:50S ribosomal protein L30 [Muribaculaceae bacterium]